MRKLLTILALFGVACVAQIPKSKCTREVVKVAENNVEVRYFIELKSGEKIVIDAYTESYGQNRLDEEREANTTLTDSLKEAEWEAERQAKLDKAAEKAALLDSLDAEIESEPEPEEVENE